MSSDIDEKTLKDIKEQICPLLEDNAVYDTLIKVLHSPKVKKTFSRIKRNNSLIKTVAKRLQTKKEMTLLYTVIYLFEVETAGNLICDILIILLSAKGHFFHIEPDNESFFIRHAVSIEDLETPSVTLGKKLNFLKKNKLNCLAKNIKHRLRDKIAHVDFEIDENGDFFKYTKKGKKPVDIKSEWFKLSDFTTAIISQMAHAIEKH
jgi:hypothetical protein